MFDSCCVPCSFQQPAYKEEINRKSGKKYIPRNANAYKNVLGTLTYGCNNEYKLICVSSHGEEISKL